MSDKLVGRFTALVERAFSQNMEKLANHDFNKYQHLFKDEYDTAIKIVISIKDLESPGGADEELPDALRTLRR